MKKWIWKMNDNLCENFRPKVNLSAAEPKIEFVHTAIKFGWTKATKYFYKHGSKLLIDSISKFFVKSLAPKAATIILPNAQGALIPITIPKGVDAILDIKTITNMSIEDLLSMHFFFRLLNVLSGSNP